MQKNIPRTLPHSICRFVCACLTVAVMLTGSVFSAFSVAASEHTTDTLALSAQAALLLDAESGTVIYEHNARTRLPMASTTKIMTALVVMDLLSPDAAICIDKAAIGIEGSSIYLYEGEWLTVRQLLMGLLLESANDAAVALAIACCGSVDAFAEKMNQKAAALGLSDTHFENPHGLDGETHYTTAYDLALISAAALADPVLREIMSTRRAVIPLCDMQSPDQKMQEMQTTQDALPVGSRVLLNHNKMLRYYDGAIGVKTGYTQRSGRCLVSAAERDGLTLIAVTLNAPDDWSDHTRLLDLGFSQYTRITLCDTGEYQPLLPIGGGKEQYVLLTNVDAAEITLPRDHGSITCRVELPHLLLAPIAQNDTIGQLVFLCDTDGDGRSEEIATVALHALYGVDALPPPTLLERIAAFFRHLFGIDD